MKHIIGYFLVITFIPIAIVVWQSGWVQQRVNPESYWSERVAHLEETAEFYQNDIYSCWLELKKLRNNQNIEIQQHILDGLPPSRALELYTSDVGITMEVCQTYQKTLQEVENELEIAKAKLSKVIGE